MFSIETNTCIHPESAIESSTNTKPGRHSRPAIRHWLLAGVFAASAGGAVQADPDIGFCTHCSNAGFAWSAEQAAPPTVGTHPVYVIDTSSGEVRYFDVMVWWDCGGNLPQSVTPRSGTDSGEGSGAFTQSNCIHKEAAEGSGDATFIMHMQDAHYAVKEFVSPEGLTIPSEEIPNAPDSAVDLIGPDDSIASYHRGNFNAGVADHLESAWGQLMMGWADVAQRIANRFIGNSNYLEPLSMVTVTFPDGTKVRALISQISTGPGEMMVLIEVLPETARLPDGRMVPQQEAHFESFYYEGDSGIVDALWALANLYGIPVTGPDGGGGGRIACTIVDGEIIQCVVLPQ